MELSFVIQKNDFFTDEFLDKAPDYLVKLYANGSLVDTLTIKAGDVVTEEHEEEASSGDPEIVRESVATASFAKSGDSVTIQVISNDATAYYDSEESAPIAVVEPQPEQPGDEIPVGRSHKQAAVQAYFDYIAKTGIQI